MLLWNEIRNRILDVYDSPKQKVLAEELGVDRATVNKWMSDDPKKRRNPTLEVLDQVVRNKGVTWDWLLEGRGRKYWEASGDASRKCEK